MLVTKSLPSKQNAKETRLWFPLQLIEALIKAWGINPVAVRISPNGKWGSISGSNPEETFRYYAQRLNKYGVAYLHVIEPRVMGTETINEGPAIPSAFFRPLLNGPILAAGSFTLDSAEDILHKVCRPCCIWPLFYSKPRFAQAFS
jgi:N-ethylmaleimide reductase